MEIIVSNKSGVPIYEQITNQIKELILDGELQAGELLPSIRVLAKSLRIGVITAQRAYEDLQRDGFIETTAGKGTYVAMQSQEFVREEVLRKIDDHLQEAAVAARKHGISLDKVKELLELFYAGEEG